MVQQLQSSPLTSFTQDGLWFKDAIIYEVPVRAFADSNGDGIGDFRGLTEKLDYLQDLGVTAVWLLPFFPSPLKDDGYDIADYTSINPIYGTLEDFKAFLEAAHQRGIRVIVELIINHTSDQHPWFQRARRAPKGSPERDFYVWSDTPQKYEEARIIFQDFETSNWAWDPVAKAYYWHRFYSHQPDLNYDSPQVRQAVFEVLDFWLALGVDGFRMDAVPYLYEREGTNCENLPETHNFLQQLRTHVDENFSNRMLLAEANQWPEDAAQYYGAGDECHMNFHFPLMPRLFMALRMEDSFPIADILQQTPTIPDNCQWALFLRNHDELTLEMVTDEDRDYMYRVYAQDPEMRLNLGIRRRLAPLLGNDRRQIELLNGLLLSLPGTPVIYYGDEIGMGDNIYVGDRNGVRTPMQWSADRNAGFSRTSPHRLYLPVIVESEYHYEAINVEAQRANANSLWYWMKRLITTRKRFRAFGRGSFEILHSHNRKVLAFTRTHDQEHILVVANLSRFVQTVELDLAAFKGMIPAEIFGRTQFPAIGEPPYFLSLGPYAFYWFTLTPQPGESQPSRAPAQLPTLTVSGSWQTLFSRRASREALELCLPGYLSTCPWFDRGRTIQAVHIIEALAIPAPDREWGSRGPEAGGKFPPAFQEAQMVWVQVESTQNEPQTYLLLLAAAGGEFAKHLLSENRQVVVARLQTPEDSETGVLFDVTGEKPFWSALLQGIVHRQAYAGQAGQLVATAKTELSASAPNLTPVPVAGKQSHTVIVYGDYWILKLLRKLEAGIHPELEVERFLAQKQQVRHLAPVVGALEYHRAAGGVMTVGIVQELIQDAQGGWNCTLDSLRDYFERVSAQQAAASDIPLSTGSLLGLQAAIAEMPDLVYDQHEQVSQAIGSYQALAQLLGRCTAELHMALASDPDHPSFTPEPFSVFYQRSIYQSARNLSGQVFIELNQRLASLSAEVQPLAHTVLNQQDALLGRFQLVLNQKITALRIRCHGDYRLGQVLYTGNDFIIIDFEGDPDRSLSERRIKRSPLRDVASMLQSFCNAAYTALGREIESGMIRPQQLPVMETWRQIWTDWVSATFLNAYLETASQASFLPKTRTELQVLLESYLLEKAIAELGHDLRHRPDRIEISLRRVLHLQGLD